MLNIFNANRVREGGGVFYFFLINEKTKDRKIVNQIKIDYGFCNASYYYWNYIYFTISFNRLFISFILYVLYLITKYFLSILIYEYPFTA